MPAVSDTAVVVYGVELAAQGLAVEGLVEGGAAGYTGGEDVGGCDFEVVGCWGGGFVDIGQEVVVFVVVVDVE